MAAFTEAGGRRSGARQDAEMMLFCAARGGARYITALSFNTVVSRPPFIAFTA